MCLSRLLVHSVVLAAFANCVSGPLSAQNGIPPQNVTITFDVDPGDPLGSCAFPINISAEGKAKTIILRSGNLILTSPDLNATVTNLSKPAKQVNLNITGVWHQTTSADGSVTTMVTGRNLLTDPVAGVVLALGNFSFAFDANGNLVQPLTQQGGLLIDICALLN